eukprot:TRINITY_DN12093_c0_g1_i1.p1 TRINITY_DN12093_c0_g1~~TRINITY_DN12093_c0_g1_i1.p1  ORF type:complete len:452 (-),score=86.26 TRINITY_DN12093_c0_g1_i1:17-1372(-)
MSTIYHPNVCLFMGACTQKDNLFMVSEYLPRGDLNALLKSEVTLSLYKRMKMARDAAYGVNWLHCSNPVFIHRDLKASNLLVDENDHVKVCDFGLSDIKPQGENLKEKAPKGTPLWMAPEVMLSQTITEKCDVYSFGIVLWEILTGKVPFPNHTKFQLFKKAVCIDHERPEIPPDTLPSLSKLMTSCWDPDPLKRPNFYQIIDSLEEIVLEAAISDEWGRKFWKQHLKKISKSGDYQAYIKLNKSEEHQTYMDDVPWNDFVEEFCEFMGFHDIDLSALERPSLDPDIQSLKCLKLALVTISGGKQVVNMEKFGNILKWFGPIRDPSTTPKNNTFLDSMRELMKQEWFHGDIDDTAVSGLLSGKPGGTFLIRFSSSFEGSFTISQINKDQIINRFRITHTPGSAYFINGEPFASLQDLVAGKKLNLACPGNRYRFIFSQPSVSGYSDLTNIL